MGGSRRASFQVVINDARGGTHSFNLVGVNAEQGDTPSKIRRFLLANPGVLEQKRDEFARRYHIGKSKLDIQNFTVRRTATFRQPAKEIVLRDAPKR